jgi:hypothetical protein
MASSGLNLKKIRNLKKLLEFQQRDIDEFGRKIADTHVKQIFAGLDADGKAFPDYTPGYAVRKGQGKFEGQISRQVKPPNLTLTGKMLKSFKYLRGEGGKAELEIDYGIEDATEAKKLMDNQKGFFKTGNKITRRPDKKRVVARPNKIGPMVESLIASMFASIIARNITRILKRQTVITYEI